MTDIVFGTGIVIIWLVIVLITLISSTRDRITHWLKDKSNAMWVIFYLSLAAMLGSLWYSEVLAYQPCKLCWYQRIFMYPIVLMSFMSALRDDSQKIISYIKSMAIVGLLIALYHVVQQRLPQTGISCGSVGQSESCSNLSVNVFDLVTIPTMAATIFIAIILVTLLYGRTLNSVEKIQ